MTYASPESFPGDTPVRRFAGGARAAPCRGQGEEKSVSTFDFVLKATVALALLYVLFEKMTPEDYGWGQAPKLISKETYDALHPSQ